MPNAVQDETISPQKAENLYKAWMKEIEYALKREKKYREFGQKVVDLYEGKEAAETPFAILYSNTETMAPAVYNARPIPIVQRRFKDADPVGKAVSDVGTRTLKYLIDNEASNYDAFDDLMQAGVLDGLLTNRGLTRFKFVAQEGAMTECVYGENVRWDKFFHGYARSWKKVPWIGFEWDMTPDEVRRNFPKARGLDFAKLPEAEDSTDNRAEPRDQLTGVKIAKVYEIWDKRTKKVYFFSECCPSAPLKIVDDPLNLTGFFPVPRPMNFMRKVTTLVPTPLYVHYEQQARELNEITRRLKAIIKAIKYRGAYNSAVEGIEKVLEADDNEMVPVENVASMPDGTGMDKLLWTVPVNELASTAQQLYVQREQIKQVIYEITGISDILRGASVASETATAQNIKNQWGSLRLKKMQKEVQRYCRDCLGLMFEIAANRFELQTFMQMTGAPYLTAEQKQELQAQLAQAQQPPMPPQGMLPPGQPMAQPPAPPPVPAEVQALLAAPAWEDIYRLMQDSIAVNYRTEIETNSTIDAEAAQDKQDIAELMNAMSQFLNGVAPLVQQGVLPYEIAKEMLLVISRRYNFGMQLEDAIKAMGPPPQSPEDKPDPAELAKAETAKIEAQAAAQQTQMDMELSKMEFEHKKQLMQMKVAVEQAELRIKQQELQLQERAVQLKIQQQEAAHRQKMEQIAAQTAVAEAKATIPTKEPA